MVFSIAVLIGNSINDETNIVKRTENFLKILQILQIQILQIHLVAGKRI